MSAGVLHGSWVACATAASQQAHNLAPDDSHTAVRYLSPRPSPSVSFFTNNPSLSRRSGLPLQAVCHVLRETRHGSSRIRAGASSPQHKCEGGKSDATVVGGRAVGEHGSHRHLTSEDGVK